MEQNSGKGGAKKGAPVSNLDRMTPGLLTQIESAKQYLDNKEEIPDSVLIKILKSKLLHIRSVQMEKKANEPVNIVYYFVRLVIFLRMNRFQKNLEHLKKINHQLEKRHRLKLRKVVHLLVLFLILINRVN